MRKTGIYQKLGDLNYFIPNSLPPTNPAFTMNDEIAVLYGEASFALGQLNEMSQRLRNSKRFIKSYVIKEALLSSAIEGIHTTLMEVFSKNESKPNKETQLVLNYTQALYAACDMLQKLPLVSRILLKAHEVLMSAGAGDQSSPGDFRKQTVRVGDLVPPPATEIASLMSDLEKYINENTSHPPLIKAGLAHVQFETIHPFLDGNGRIGRLLIVLVLINSGLITLPILYPSYYFKKHHLEYYQRLDRVRTHGDFEGWIAYYLRAIKESALDAYVRAKEIEALEIKLKEFISSNSRFAKCRETAIRVLEALFEQPVASIADISQKIERVYNTVHNILQEFVRHKFVLETIINKRNRIYLFDPYLKLLEKEV